MGHRLYNGDPGGAATAYRAAIEVYERLVADQAEGLWYEIDLGGNYCNLGRLVSVGGRPADALAWYDKAVRTLAAVYNKNRRQVRAKQFLCNSHWGRAYTFGQLGRHADALADWNEAVDLSLAAQKLEMRAGRAISRLQAGQVAEAVAEVAELAKSDAWDAGHWYDFACVYAVASGKDAAKRDEYAARAVELLGRAVQAGYVDAAHMGQDSDLAPLRGRTDFRKLVADLAAKYPPPPEPAPMPRPVR